MVQAFAVRLFVAAGEDEAGAVRRERGDEARGGAGVQAVAVGKGDGRAVAARLETLQNKITARLGADAGDIFAAHAQLLAELAEATLAHDAANYAPVWQEETAQAAVALAALPDPYLRARAADIHDLAQQVLTLLADAPEAAMPDNAPFILVARDLYPLRAATLPANCLAVVLADGDPHSHAALLCQAAQRPYYSGAGDAVLALTDGAHIQITRASGEIRRLP